MWPALVADVVEACRRVGVACVTDARSVTAPCVWLRPVGMAREGCATRVTVEAIMVPGGAPTGDAAAWLVAAAAPLLDAGFVLRAAIIDGADVMVGTIDRHMEA